MLDYEIVRIGAEEWQEFREIRLHALADAPAAFVSRYADWVDASEERWRDRLEMVPLNLVARSGARPVGMVSASLDRDQAELISMYVAPEARGTGLAATLVDRVVTWAQEQDRSTFLMVRTDNDAAITAYRRAGFVDRGVPPGWPEDAPPEKRMERRLA